MMKSKRIALFACLFLLATSARADFVGVFAGIGYWNSSFGGNLISSVDVDSELALSGDSANYMYFALEHPVPLVPNIKLARTGIEDSGVGTLASTFTFAGQTFNVNQSVATNVDLTHTDLTLYYEIIDVGMDLDVGLTARYFQGDVKVDTAIEEIDGALPMLYGRAKFGLPFTGTYLGADANFVSYSGNQLSDLTLTVGWETENFILPEFGIEGGYRRMALDLDPNDVDVDVDMDVDGFFINLTGHF